MRTLSRSVRLGAVRSSSRSRSPKSPRGWRSTSLRSQRSRSQSRTRRRRRARVSSTLRVRRALSLYRGWNARTRRGRAASSRRVASTRTRGWAGRSHSTVRPDIAGVTRPLLLADSLDRRGDEATSTFTPRFASRAPARSSVLSAHILPGQLSLDHDAAALDSSPSRSSFSTCAIIACNDPAARHPDRACSFYAGNGCLPSRARCAAALGG